MTIVNDTIVQASFTSVTYDHKNIFIIQATGKVLGNVELLKNVFILTFQLALSDSLLFLVRPIHLTISTAKIVVQTLSCWIQQTGFFSLVSHVKLRLLSTPEVLHSRSRIVAILF